MRTFVSAFAASAALMLSSAAVYGAPPGAVTILQAYRVASGGKAWDAKAALKSELTVVGAGVAGTDTSITDLRDGRTVDHSALGPIKNGQGFDGGQAWQQDSSGSVNIEVGGDALRLSINHAYRDANQWWRPDFGGAKVTYDGTKPCGGLKCSVLTVTPKGGESFDAWFDTKTHLLWRTVEKQGGQTMTTTLSEYASVNGVRLPHKIVSDSGVGAKYVLTETLTKAQLLPTQLDSAYAPPKARPHDFSIARSATRTSFPFQLYNNYIYASAWINGQGPLLFIFDTGGQNILVPSAAKALSIKTEGALPGIGGGETRNLGFARISTRAVGSATFNDQTVEVLDFVPNRVEGVDIEGMIGFSVFKRFVPEIDYRKHTITLIAPKRFDPTTAGTPIKSVFNDDLAEVDCSFEGIRGKFDIDTGARNDLTVNGSFWRPHDLRAKHPKAVLAVDGWGTGGAAPDYATRGGGLTIGAVKTPDVVASLSRQKKSVFATGSCQGNIGAGVLKRFMGTLDYTNQTIFLKLLPERVADMDTFDPSGIAINARKDGVEAMDVTGNGPAQAGGIEPGDVITAVNGKPAASIPWHELRRQLRDDAPGTWLP